MESKNVTEPRWGDGPATPAAGFGGSLLHVARWPLIIVLVSYFAFWPAFDNEFVNWDDEKILLQNPHYRGLGLANLRWMFTTALMGHYHPLVWLTYALDYSVWGLNPRGYFLSNLLLHVAAAVCFYAVACRLLRRACRWSEDEAGLGAGIAALLFAVHPLRVESVAWASERRDVLSGLFFLLSVLCYLRFAESGERRGGKLTWYLCSLATCTASLFSKATGVGLPFVLLLLDWYPLRAAKKVSGTFCRNPGAPGKGASHKRFLTPFSLRLLVEKLPFALVAAVATLVVAYAQQRSETVASVTAHGLLPRLLAAAYGLCFYVRKTVLPTGLSPFVPMPERSDLLGGTYWLTAVVVLLVGALLLAGRRRWPAGISALAYYVILLLPVSGLVQIGPQLVADRYSYLSCLSLALLAAAGAAYLWRVAWSRGRVFRWPVVIVTCVLFAVLTVLTRRQVDVWQDSTRLWSVVLQRFPDSAVAHLNLATAFAERGLVPQAVPHFTRATVLKPTLVEAHYGLGTALFSLGKFEEASRSFRMALEIKPDHADSWNNLGGALLQAGQVEEAVKAYERAVVLRGHDAMATYNLGQSLARAGRAAEAIAWWHRAAERAPNSPVILDTLAWHLATSEQDSLRNGQEAERLAERACMLTGRQDPSCLSTLAAAHAELGRFDQAVRTAREAIGLARQKGTRQLASEIEDQVQLYQSKQPFRSGPR